MQKKSGQKSKKCPQNAKENLTTPTASMGLHSNKEINTFPYYYHAMNLISWSLYGPLGLSRYLLRTICCLTINDISE